MGFFDFLKPKKAELPDGMREEMLSGLHRLDDRPTGWSLDVCFQTGKDIKRMRKELGRPLTREEVMNVFNQHIEYQANRPWVDTGRTPLGFRGHFSVFED